MVGRTDRWIDEWMEGQIDECLVGVDGYGCLDVCVCSL